MTDNSSITINIPAIYHAWLSFRQGKKASRAIVEFEYNLEKNLFDLCNDLNEGEYKHEIYSHSILNEKKRRDNYVASVRDRVVHRLIYDFLAPRIDKKLDFDVWSCRKNKGLHACLSRVQLLLNRYDGAFIWRGDIEKFFDSVPHDLLNKVLKFQIECAKTYEILREIISSYSCEVRSISTTVGLPIGNLTSQLLANIYLDQFDKYVRAIIKPLAYVRYGDDFIIFSQNEYLAQQSKRFGQKQLKNLGLKVNKNHNIIVRTYNGLHFLGHNIGCSEIVICNQTRNRLFKYIDARNVSSYSALNIDSNTRRMLPWLI